ncbi:DUF3347 domain-containing protein [Algoriphagus yeomjeoni]|uniref:DUF3347 domain-containing protein n=1 Tax=Algoriphagus yeomjeoni TaxID=291403 RepID=UPI003CE4499C
MKNLRLPIAVSVLIALSMACSSKSTHEDHMENETSQEMSSATSDELDSTPATIISFKEESTTQIFNTYFGLKDALVETNGEKVSEEAKKLEALLTDEKYNSMKEEVQKIAGTTDTAIQRDAFDELSEQMIELAKSSELASGNLFLQHCPMANGNKGANWISLSEEIRNPYFGDKMMTCGSVTEKI